MIVPLPSFQMRGSALVCAFAVTGAGRNCWVTMRMILPAATTAKSITASDMVKTVVRAIIEMAETATKNVRKACIKIPFIRVGCGSFKAKHQDYEI